MRQTTWVKKENVNKKWYLINAKDVTLGKLSTLAASYLRGKHKCDFSPNVDMGDNIIVINAVEVALKGNKEKNKLYYSHSGYPGGLKSINAAKLRIKKPTAIVEKSIKGMLPHTKLGDKQRGNLFVYADDNHKHQAQKPIILEVK